MQNPRLKKNPIANKYFHVQGETKGKKPKDTRAHAQRRGLKPTCKGTNSNMSPTGAVRKGGIPTI